MMAFTEADRVSIREYLGFGSIFLQADPRLENAITAVQSVADGGTRPTSDAENALKALITRLKAIDTSLDALNDQSGATSVDEIKLDAARETYRLKMHARSLVHRLARILDTYPRSDIYSASPGMLPSYPFNMRTPY